jgi:hypothetical protein
MVRSRTSRFSTLRAAPGLVTRLIGVIALVLFGCVIGTGTALAAPATIAPGALSFDQNGNALQLHGLGIIKVGSTYYGFGEDKVGRSSGDAAFQAVTCYSSTNLVDWTWERSALTLQASGDLGPNRIVERPKVIFNSTTNQYVMYIHADSIDYSDAEVGVATSATPCGPYTYLGSWRPQGNQSRDMNLFKDTDGQAYLLSEDRAAGLRVYRLSADYLSAPTPSIALLTPNHESPAMVKVGGRYYLFGSSLTGWDTNDNQYTTATSLSGPWSAWANFAPAGSKTFNSQTANIITVQGSSATTYVYAGDRWNLSDLGSSPMVWLPLTINGTSVSLTWRDRWTIDTATGQWANQAVTATTIIGQASGRCVDVPSARVVPAVQVIIYDCGTASNQKWIVSSGGTIVGLQSGLCLGAAGQGTAAGTVVQTQRCDGGAAQRWTVNSDGTIRGVQSGLCLDAINAATANGTKIALWTCNGGNNQRWRLG